MRKTQQYGTVAEKIANKANERNTARFQKTWTDLKLTSSLKALVPEKPENMQRTRRTEKIVKTRDNATGA
jgi:hypothetical protein